MSRIWSYAIFSQQILLPSNARRKLYEKLIWAWAWICECYAFMRKNQPPYQSSVMRVLSFLPSNFTSQTVTGSESVFGCSSPKQMLDLVYFGFRSVVWREKPFQRCHSCVCMTRREWEREREKDMERTKLIVQRMCVWIESPIILQHFV